MRKHTLVGERLLGTFPSMVPVARLVRSSHERWDGSGYPDGLSGEEIPVGARIISICDAFDAMRSARPYQARGTRAPPLPRSGVEPATSSIPRLVEVFCRVVDQVERSAGRSPAPAPLAAVR